VRFAWFQTGVAGPRTTAGQGTRIGGEPEGTVGTDGRGGADALTLVGNLDHRGVRTYASCLAGNRIGAKTRLIPERDLGLGSLGVARSMASTVS